MKSIENLLFQVHKILGTQNIKNTLQEEIEKLLKNNTMLREINILSHNTLKPEIADLMVLYCVLYFNEMLIQDMMLENLMDIPISKGLN